MKLLIEIDMLLTVEKIIRAVIFNATDWYIKTYDKCKKD